MNAPPFPPRPPDWRDPFIGACLVVLFMAIAIGIWMMACWLVGG